MAYSGVQLDANARTVDTVSKAASINWPFAVDRRLDQLVDLANGVGANAKRNELAAAVVAAASANPGELLNLLLEYRVSRVSEIVLDVPDAAAVVDLPRYGPGRRRVS